MGLLEHSLPDNVLFTKLDQLTMRWGLRNSLWYMLFATACCAIELMQTGMSRYDFDRFGMLPRATPRQSDLMIIAGTVTYKMALRIKRLYEQMPEPKYVIAMGSCANCGGGFVKSYNVLNGVDKIIPVDVYVPGCPPKPEALIEGCLKLMDKINGQPRLVRKAEDGRLKTEG